MDRKKHKQLKPVPRGFPKIYGARIQLPLTDTMLAALDSARDGEETRLDVIRTAIERELKRRERSRVRD
jgi:hypothetical protein